MEGQGLGARRMGQAGSPRCRSLVQAEVYRGIMVSNGYQKGEFDLQMGNPTQLKSPEGLSTGNVTLTDNKVTIKFTDGPLVGQLVGE